MKDEHRHESEKIVPCPMCEDALDIGGSDTMKLKCGHEMHRHCFKEMNMMSQGCPTCEQEVDTSSTDDLLSIVHHNDNSQVDKSLLSLGGLKIAVTCHDCN